MARELSSVSEVMSVLGGYRAVADLTGRKPGAAWNWTKFPAFPSDTYVVMQAALQERRCTAPASLWGMVASDRADQPAEAVGR